MKTLKPGQICTINNVVYRAKRKTNGCENCDFDGNMFYCPGIIDSKTLTVKVHCQQDNIILIRSK